MMIIFKEENDTKVLSSYNVRDYVLKRGLKMYTFTIISIWVLIVIAFGMYWHALRISQKVTKCLTLLEKIAEGIKK